jgi:hypothetical protein
MEPGFAGDYHRRLNWDCYGNLSSVLRDYTLLVLENDYRSQRVTDGLKQNLADKFGIQHTTIQFECANCGQGAVTV